MLNKQKKASATVYIIAFFITFLAFAAFAVDGTIVWTNRIKLQNATESTALAAASEFSNYSTATAATVESDARTLFTFLKHDNLESVNEYDINKFKAVADTSNHKVCITTNMVSQPFFLTFLGVSGINLQAHACAINEELPITANYSGINWVTTSAAYFSDILSKDLNYNDTAILPPVGNLVMSKSYDETTNFVKFNLINKDTTEDSLSLGPGGFITIKLPAPIIDKTGYDLHIAEGGNAIEGYMVFAGIDVDPTNPYVKSGEEGGGIVWVNITSTGYPENTDLLSLALDTASDTNLGPQEKFYGSGYFDIGAKGLSMAKYIRIIDDNDESAIYETMDSFGNTTYKKVNIYSEASTTTPGADIKYVTVMNHVRLTTGS